MVEVVTLGRMVTTPEVVNGAEELVESAEPPEA